MQNEVSSWFGYVNDLLVPVDTVALSLSSLTCASLQLHRADSDGDGPLQAAEDPEAEQRPCLLFPLPDPARPQVHSLCQRVAPWPETLQSAHQHHLWPQGQRTHTHAIIFIIVILSAADT